MEGLLSKHDDGNDIKMDNRTLSTVIQTTRPSFLLLAVVTVFLGFGLAFDYAGVVNYFDAALALIGGVLAHISVNTFNEYFDFRSGLDATTEKTPFSGGSKGLVHAPHAQTWVLATAVVSLALTFTIGMYFIHASGWAIAPLGILGAIVVVSYTSILNKQPVLCWLAPGLGFGPLMVVGTFYVLTHTFTLQAIAVSMLPFLLANNLLLLNQLPDVAADQQVGRKHVAIAYGKCAAIRLYGITVMVSIVSLLVCVLMNWLPLPALLSLIPLSLGFIVYFRIVKHSENMLKNLPFMGLNVFITLVTPIILAVTLMN
jgi:1,4-dihydroxy-2-naphthoate octaprenyltransferase